MRDNWRKRARVVLLIAIPALVLVYVGYLNYLPLGGTRIGFVDVGGNDITGSLRIIGPFTRISDKIQADSITYRELEGWGVYFESEISGVGSAGEIVVRVRFKDNFPEGESFILGAKDEQEWSYNWKDFYVPFYEELAGLPLIAQNEAVKIYSTGGQQDIESANSFLENPPLYTTIATNNSLLVNQAADAEEWGEIQDEFPGEEASSPVVIRTALRGPHTCWTYVANELLELNLIKRDLNWREGADELNIEIYSIDNELVWTTTVADDGDETDSGEPGALQTKSFSLPGLEEGAYRIEFIGGSDLLITRIEINQEKFVVSDNLYWAGTNTGYLGQSPEQDSIYFRSTGPDEIGIQTSHNSGLQTVTISDGVSVAELDINEINTQFSTTLELAGYVLTSEKQDIIIESDNYISFTPGSFFIPRKCEVVDLGNDLDWILQNADFVLLDYSNYIEPVDDGEWIITSAVWNVEDIYVFNNKLNFCFNVPHLNDEAYSDRSIPIDWIEVKVTTSSLWNR